MKVKRTSTLFPRFWWTILLMVFCYGFYLHAMHKKKGRYHQLHAKVDMLESELKVGLEQQKDLLAQIDSQSDPAWIELLIKKHLGMVPSGQTKVYFEKE